MAIIFKYSGLVIPLSLSRMNNCSRRWRCCHG